jgi:CRP-like cAMP-binding protein
MNLNEEVELLKGVPILAKIEPAKLKLIAFTSERMNYAEGQELCHQGESGDAMYVILGGEAEVLIDSRDGGQISVAELKKSDFFGEIAILLDVPRTATIKAKTPVSTLKITKEMFYRLVAEFPQLAVEVMRELAHRMEDTNNKLADTNNKLAQATANKAASPAS